MNSPISPHQIQKHMEVVGSDGAHVGTVDGIEGEQIKLTRKDPEAGGEHHYIEMQDVDRVEDRVLLSCTAAEAKAAWETAPSAGMVAEPPERPSSSL